MRAGEYFEEQINQGSRTCTVIAVDEASGNYLYEYEMPEGSTAIRNQHGRPVGYKDLSLHWLRLIEDQFGIDNLIARPQQGWPKGQELHKLLQAKIRTQDGTSQE